LFQTAGAQGLQQVCCWRKPVCCCASFSAGGDGAGGLATLVELLRFVSLLAKATSCTSTAVAGY